jgi:hypothetical protein
MKCKTCKYWNNKQAELSYNEFHGICTCFAWKFGIKNYSDVRVLNRNNLKDNEIRTQEFESQSAVVPYGQVTPSRYCLVTAEEFGCIHYQIKKRTK